MKFGISKVLVLLAFSVLQAHNFIPHHHHHDIESHATQAGHEEEGHHHHHFPFANLHIDELFYSKIVVIHGSPPIAVVPDFVPFPENNLSQTTVQVTGPDYLRGHPPLPPFLSAFSFRGPPAA
jgi:hypothetical protein